MDLLENGAQKEAKFYETLDTLPGLIGDSWRYLRDYVSDDSFFDDDDDDGVGVG